MTAHLVVDGSLSAAFPGIAAAIAAAIAEVNLEVGDLRLQIDAAANLAAGLRANIGIDANATLAASLAYAADAQLALAANLSAGINADLTAQLDAQLGIVAELGLKLSAKLALVAELTLLLTELGAAVRVYAYRGRAGDLNELRAKVATDLGVDQDIYVTTIVALSREAQTSLSLFMKVT